MLNYEIEGLDNVDAALDQVSKTATGVDILDEAAALLLSRIRQRFLEQKDPFGNAWVPSFAAQTRAATGRGGGTLFDTGNLFHSLQVYADSPTSRKVGTDVEYAGAHQFGIGTIARPFIGANEEDTALMVRLVLRRLGKALS